MSHARLIRVAPPGPAEDRRGGHGAAGAEWSNGNHSSMPAALVCRVLEVQSRCAAGSDSRSGIQHASHWVQLLRNANLMPPTFGVTMKNLLLIMLALVTLAAAPATQPATRPLLHP